MRRLPELTGMRGVAAVLVVFFHIVLLYSNAAGRPDGPLADAFSAGWIGVDFFFVLSGFLLSIPLLSDRSLIHRRAFWRTYLAKRYLRIAPPYYAAIFLVLGGHQELEEAILNPQDLLLHLAYAHSLTLDSFQSIDPVYWTLAVEFQFYLVLPFLALLFVRRWWVLPLIAAMGLSIAWRAAVYDGPESYRTLWLGSQLPGFLGHFALGIAAARLWREGFSLQRAQGWAAYAFGTLILAVSFALFVDPYPGLRLNGPHGLGDMLFMRALVALGFACLILTVASARGFPKSLLASQPMQALGNVSYSVYLVQFPVIQLVVLRVPRMVDAGFLPFAAVSTGAVVLCAGVLWALVEAPALRVKARLFHGAAPTLRAATKPPLGEETFVPSDQTQKE